MILLNQYMVGDKVDILKEYGSFFVDLFKRVIELDIIYIILIIVLIIGVSILLSFATKKALEEMNIKVNGVVWVPFINILYFFTKAIHSLMAIVFCLLVLLIIPIPHPVHGIFTISSLVSNKMCHIIYVALSPTAEDGNGSDGMYSSFLRCCRDNRSCCTCQVQYNCESRSRRQCNVR